MWMRVCEPRASVDVAQPDAAEQGTLEPANRQRRGQVLIGLADDQCANAVLAPTRFDDQEPEADEDEDRDEQTDDDPGHRHRNPPGPTSPHHGLIVADSSQQSAVGSAVSSQLSPAVAADQLEEAIEIEGLSQERDGVDLGGPTMVQGRQDDDRDGRERRVGLLLPTELPAVHDGHHQVEEDDVWPVALPEVFEGLTAVGHGGGDKPFEREQLRHHVAKLDVVFDDQDGTTSDCRR